MILQLADQVVGEGATAPKIVIVSSCPAYDLKPFSDSAKQFLLTCAQRAGIQSADIRFESLLTFLPQARKVELVSRDVFEQERDKLITRLNALPAVVVVPCGNQATEALTGYKSADKYQLSILEAASLPRKKIIPLNTPEYVFANYRESFFTLAGFERVKQEMASPLVKRTSRIFHTMPTFLEAAQFLGQCMFADFLSVDIETQGGQISCVGLAMTPGEAMSIQCLPSHWSTTEFHQIWTYINDVLGSPAKKVFQNFIYDCTYFAKYGVQVKNLWHDTMLAQKFLYPELPMGLDTIARIHTRETYWKDEGKDWRNVGDWNQFQVYNCFIKGSQVVTENGLEYIDEIVRNKKRVRVRSFNEKTHKFEWKPVIGWIKNKHPEPINWHQIKVEHAPNKKGLITTPDHKFKTQRGWVEAKDVKVHDMLMLEGVSHQYGTIAGTLLGDSSFGFTTNQGVAYVQCSQIHEELIKLKQDLFGGTVTKRKISPKHNKYKTKTKYLYDLYIPPTHQLKRLVRFLRPKNKKVTIPEALNSMGVALWFMDDGCRAKNTGRLAVHGFSISEREKVADFFSFRYGQPVRLTKCGSLYFGTKAFNALCNEIGKLIPETLRYKILDTAPKYAPGAWRSYRSEICPLNTRVVESKQFTGKYTGRGYKHVSYCLTVADNHNFLTPYGLARNCKDAAITLEAAHNQRKELDQANLTEPFERLVMSMAPIAAEMCWRGMPINPELRERELTSTKSEIETLTTQLNALVEPVLGKPINPRSPAQVKEFFKAKKYRLPQKKGKESTDATSLMKLKLRYPNDATLGMLLSLSEKNKYVSSYLKPMPYADNRYRFGLNLHGAETGRYSCRKDPWDNGYNMQTVSARLKKIYEAPEGWLWLECDLKQADSRFVAWDAPEPTLMKFYNDGTDIHRFVAARPELFNKPLNEISPDERQLGKKVGHASNYGMRGNRLSEICLLEMDLSIAPARADQMLSGYHRVFPGIRMWQQKIANEVRRTRKLTTPMGRERYFYARTDDDVFREAYAYRPQSTVTDIINCLIKHVDKNRNTLLLHHAIQTHDAAVFLVHESYVDQALELIKAETEWNPQLSLAGGLLQIPIEIKLGRLWGEAKKIYG